MSLTASEALNGAEPSKEQPRERPWALVLAGGDGRRLQVLTRKIAGAPIPKQYCRITGDRSLLEATLARIVPLVPRERTLVVVNRSHLELALPQLRDVPPGNVIVQPGNRDTGPGVVFGLLDLPARRPRAPVAVFPSDHYVDDGSSFREHVERATFLVDRFPTKIALLGIRPTHPEPAFGYIEPGPPLVVRGLESRPAYQVAAFHEKQSIELARHTSYWSCLSTASLGAIGELLRQSSRLPRPSNSRVPTDTLRTQHGCRAPNSHALHH